MRSLSPQLTKKEQLSHYLSQKKSLQCSIYHILSKSLDIPRNKTD